VAPDGNPRRTPLYGGVLIVLAMVAATVVTETRTPLGVRVVVYLLALGAAGAGALMTLRDYS
jgi:UDP-N-acetylmuramyl pentapeptide phosphotransferase/UDP-N-acetylglucosamine-1-phosphate transferase